jgi:hypothetical protein
MCENADTNDIFSTNAGMIFLGQDNKSSNSGSRLGNEISPVDEIHAQGNASHHR